MQRLEMVSSSWKKHFDSPGRTELIWGIVKDVEGADFHSAVTTMIESMRKPPMPADFRDAIKGCKVTSTSSLGVEMEEANCKDCMDSGLVPLVRKEHYEPWARCKAGRAPCHCNKGRDLLEADKMAPERSKVGFKSQYGFEWNTSYAIQRRSNDGVE